MKRKSGNRRASPAIHQTEIGCCLLTTSLSLYCCSTPEIAHSLSNIHAPYDMSASCVAAESDWERHRLFGEGALACEEEPLEVICLPPCHHYSFRSQTTRGRGIQNSESTHSSSLACQCLAAAARTSPRFSLPSLHTAYCMFMWSDPQCHRLYSGGQCACALSISAVAMSALY